jgi:hypothetical protein
MPIIDASRPALFLRRLFSHRSRGVGLVPDDANIVGFTEKNQPIIVETPNREACFSAFLTGGSGSGKTVLSVCILKNEIVIAAKIPEEDRPSFICIDVKYDLLEYLIGALSAEAPEILSRIKYLDVFSPGGFAFNFCKMPTPPGTSREFQALALAEIISTVSTQRGNVSSLSTGSRQIDVLFHCFLAAMDIKDKRANILMALDGLSDPRSGLLRLAMATTNQRARAFLMTNGSSLSPDLRSSSAARIRTAFLSSDLERIVSADHCIDMDEITGPNSITLMDLSSPPSGMQSLQSFYAGIFCRAIFDSLMARKSPSEMSHCRIVLDEAQITLNNSTTQNSIETILSGGRSRNISTFIITQTPASISEISPELLKIIFTNCRDRWVGRSSSIDSTIISKMVSAKKGTDEPTSIVQSRISTALCNLSDREFMRILPGSHERFRTVDLPIDKWRQAAEKHAAEIEAMKRRYRLEDQPPRATLSDLVPELPKKTRSPRRGVKAARKPVQGRTTSPGTMPESPRQTAPRGPRSADTAGSKPETTSRPKPRSKWG